MNLARTARAGGFAAAAILAASPALAHHPLGGETPATLVHGVLSGIGHPMIGLDHFAFLVAMGVASAAMGRTFVAPLAFLAASMAGVLVAHAGLALPAVEPVVAGSALLIGLAVVSGVRMRLGVALGLFALAGLFHGNAYGAAIVGAETTPLAGYLAGLFATQYALATGAGLFVGRVLGGTAADALPVRLTGALAAGVGFSLLFEMAEGAFLGPLA